MLQQNILFKNEFDDCASINKNLKIIYTVTGEGEDQTSSSVEWRGERSRISKEMIIKYDRLLDFSTPKTGTLFFVPTLNMLDAFSSS
jgi:hypothetical protein